MKTRIISVISLLIVLLSSSPVHPQVKKIAVSYGTASPTHLGLWVAKEAGLFQKYGLTVDLVYTRQASTVVQMLMSGDIAIAFAGGVAAINAGLAGADVVIVGGVETAPPFQIWAVRGIRSPQDLKGKIVGVTTPGSTTDLTVRLALEKWGLKPDRDVTIRRLGSLPEIQAALTAGSIQSGVLSFPANREAKNRGLTQLVDLGEVARDYPTLSILTSRKFADKEPKLLMDFLKGYTEGVQFFFRDKDSAKRIIAKYTGIGDRETIDAAYDHAIRYIEKVPRLNIKAVETALKMRSATDPKLSQPNAERFVDASFYRDLDQSGFFKWIAEKPSFSPLLGPAAPPPPPPVTKPTSSSPATKKAEPSASPIAKPSSPQATPSPAAPSQLSPATPKVPTTRIYNAWFQEGGPANRQPSLLEIGRIYTLFFYIGGPRPENLLASREVSGALQREASSKDIDVVVRLYCPICQTVQQSLALRLPAKGDTEILAFTVQATEARDDKLVLSVIYKNAVYDNFQIPVRVGSSREVAVWEKEKSDSRSIREAPEPSELEKIPHRDFIVELYEEQSSLRVSLAGTGIGRSRSYNTGLTPSDLVTLRQQLWKTLYLIMNEKGSIKYEPSEKELLVFRETTRDAILLPLAEIGYSLYRRLFESDPELASRMREIKDQSKTHPVKLNILTPAGLYFPFGLLNDEEASVRWKTFSIEGFWGLRYIIEQGFLESQRKIAISDIDNRSGMKLLMAVYDEEHTKPKDRTKYMALRDSQINWFKKLQPAISTEVIREENTFLAELRKQTPSYDIIYFYTHASSGGFETELKDADGNPHEVFIPNSQEASFSLTPPPPPLPSSQAIRAAELRKEKFELINSHVVFMNTCESGTIVALSTNNFVTPFWEKGVRSILVTETQMWQNFAKEFAGKFFGNFFAGNDLGTSLLRIRESYMKQNNPFALLYTLYGDPTTKVSSPLQIEP